MRISFDCECVPCLVWSKGCLHQDAGVVQGLLAPRCWCGPRAACTKMLVWSKGCLHQDAGVVQGLLAPRCWCGPRAACTKMLVWSKGCLHQDAGVVQGLLAPRCWCGPELLAPRWAQFDQQTPSTAVHNMFVCFSLLQPYNGMVVKYLVQYYCVRTSAHIRSCSKETVL